jgi:hypothetical protein
VIEIPAHLGNPKKGVDLLSVAKEAVGEIQKSFTQPDDDWIPVVMIQSGDAILPVVMQISDDKESTGKSLENLLRNTGAEQAVLISSSWVVSFTGSNEVPEFIPVRDQPDRKEVLVLTHATRDSIEMVMADIERHKSSAPTLGSWSAPMDGLFVQGIFPDAMRLGIVG